MFSTGFAFLKNVTASGGGYDPDAEAYFTQVLAVGGSLTIPEKNAVNQLTLDFKTAGIYNKFDIFLPVLGSTSASCKINLVEPSNATYDWDYLGTPVFSSTGVLGNGTDAVMRSIWKMVALVKADFGDVHWASYQKYNAGSAYHFNGVLDINSNYQKCGLGTFYYPGYGGAFNDDFAGSNYSDPDFNGLLYIDNNGTNVKSYINNSFDTLSAVSSVGYWDANAGNSLLGLYWAGQTNNNFEFSSNEVRSFSIGSYLNGTERTDYYNAVQTFQTSLGRNV